MGIRKFLVLALITSGLYAQSQTPDGEFTEAKRLLANRSYGAALSAFNDLKEDSKYGAYASFYSGYCLYQREDKKGAILQWKQLLSEYPKWEQSVEVLYWLSLTSFEENRIEDGLGYLESYNTATTTSKLSRQLVPKYLKDAGIEDLEKYQSQYPQNRELAQLLANAIANESYENRDTELLQQLIDEYDFERSALSGGDVENVFRSRYSIAMALPFMFESLENPNTVIRNSLITRLYQGMLLAQEDLASDGIGLDFYDFDTRKNKEVTGQQLEKMKDADLIVGPLYPDPIDTVRSFSQENQINMINPLTSNIDYVGNNPFAFLFKPDYRTMASALGDYAVGQHDNKNALVYFSDNERDSLFAQTYRERIEIDSFKVLEFRSLDELSAKLLLDTLVETYEEIYTKEVADSIMEIEGRFVKTRRLKEAEELHNEEAEFDSLKIPFFFEEPEEGEELDESTAQKMVAYEMKLKVAKDSIGHIMIAGRSNTIINNILSARAAREDSSGVYGYGTWFNFKTTSYELLGQIGVKLAWPEYIDSQAESTLALKERFIERFGVIPTTYHYQGYEFIQYVGRMLDQHGKYFQNGFGNGLVDGIIMQGVDYSGTNVNQVVPIVTMEDYEVIQVNKYGN